MVKYYIMQNVEEKRNYSEIFTILGVILGAAAIIALGIYLYATANPYVPGKTIIRWAVDPSPIRKNQIELFESKNPDIEVINDPSADAQRLLTQLAGGVPPDVMAIYDPQSLRLFSKNDVLLDLQPYVDKYKIPVDKLYPALEPYVYYKDPTNPRAKKQLVGIPENCGPFVLFYNKKLFREAGLPYPKPGWTWDECLAAAKKLTKNRIVNGRSVPDVKGLYIDNSNWWFFIWMYGGRLFSPDGKTCTMDSPEVKKGIRFWADLRLKHHVMPTTSEAASMAPTGAWGSDALLFRESKVAMVVNGRWMIIQYREQKDLEWDVVSVPHGPHRFTLLASKSYAIPADCKHKDAALRFMRHLLDEDNQKLVADYGDGIPVLQDPNIMKAYLYNPAYPKERNNKLHLDEMKYARVQEYSPYVNNLDVVSIMSIELDRMWMKEQTPDEACDAIAKRINALIKRNLANPNFLD